MRVGKVRPTKLVWVVTKGCQEGGKADENRHLLKAGMTSLALTVSSKSAGH